MFGCLCFLRSGHLSCQRAMIQFQPGERENRRRMSSRWGQNVKKCACSDDVTAQHCTYNDEAYTIEMECHHESENYITENCCSDIRGTRVSGGFFQTRTTPTAAPAFTARCLRWRTNDKPEVALSGCVIDCIPDTGRQIPVRSGTAGCDFRRARRRYESDRWSSAAVIVLHARHAGLWVRSPAVPGPFWAGAAGGFWMVACP